ncbi:type II secretion system protein XpsH [Stenotrophomonas chelatiphaga]|uniref:type II secretion system protein XpsH n=1 Tax=Stenotrophomonas chelatiphaga TaxID=517011 RepID=UPI002896B31D|nr:GspH/FimT family pseudopilin [Stenotrophomonas chelatiphaga]
MSGLNRQRRSPRRTRQLRVGGMSLLEMLLVIALIALVGLVTGGMFARGMAGAQLRNAGKELASQLRLVRAEAVARGSVQRFVIEPRARRWEGAGGRSGTLPESLQVSFEGAAQLQQGAGRGAIEFHPDGGSSGGRIVIQRGDARWRIDVGWLTGEVRSGPDAVQ